MSHKNGRSASADTAAGFLKGSAGFDSWYSALYGARWPALREALLAPARKTAWEPGLTRPYYLDAGSAAAAVSLPLAGDEHILDLCAAPGGKTPYTCFAPFGRRAHNRQ